MSELLMDKLTPPDKETIIANIRRHLPSLLEKPIWIAHSYVPKKDGSSFTKLPRGKTNGRNHTVSAVAPGYTFEEAIEDGYPGIKMKNTSIVIIDIDHMESFSSLNPDFRDFLIQQDSYMETSVSGKGLHVLFHCANKNDLIGWSNLNKDVTHEGGGEIFSNSGYVAITGNYEAGSGIQEIEAHQLKPWYENEQAEIIPLNTGYQPIKTSKEDIAEILKLCKLDQSDRIKKAYKNSFGGAEYNHYKYWFTILAACHSYAKETGQNQEISELVCKWSQTDEIAYQDDEDVIDHWKSFKEKPNNITYATLQKLANLLKFQWPNEKYTSKSKPTGRPIPQSVKNIEYLLKDYFDLKFHNDVFREQFYMTGDKDVINKYLKSDVFLGMTGPFSKKELESIIVRIAQDNKYENVAPKSIINVWEVFIALNIIRVNTFKMWLETPPESLPEDMIEPNTDISKSNFDYLMSCITLKSKQDEEMIKVLFEAFFHSIVMPLYNTGCKYAEHEFMILLVGDEAIRKTSFCKSLFPLQMREKLITTTTQALGDGKPTRDFMNNLVTSVLVILDEFDHMFNPKYKSLIKSLITQDSINLTQIYQIHAEKMMRNAALIGTTNEGKLPIEAHSNRRFAIVAAKWFDTDAMEKINWHHFYRSFLEKGKKAFANGQYLWKVSQDIRERQYKSNENFRAKSNLEVRIRQIFDFNIPANYLKVSPQLNKNLYGISQIRLILANNNVFYKDNELERVLPRVCGIYTDTFNKEKNMTPYKGTIKNGIIKQKQHVKYVLPPLRTNFDDYQEKGDLK